MNRLSTSLNTPAMNQLSEPFSVAFSNHQAGLLADAENGYRTVLEARPDHVDALHYLGVLLHQRGENEEAAKLMDRALGLALHASACWSNRGLVAAALGDLPYAVECHERALVIDPDFTNARNNLGVALQKQGLFNESIEQHKTLLAQDPDFFDSQTCKIQFARRAEPTAQSIGEAKLARRKRSRCRSNGCGVTLTSQCSDARIKNIGLRPRRTIARSNQRKL